MEARTPGEALLPSSTPAWGRLKRLGVAGVRADSAAVGFAESVVPDGSCRDGRNISEQLRFPQERPYPRGCLERREDRDK